MSIDGHQKHSKAMENTGGNSLSTLLNTLDILSPGCCFPQAEVCRKWACAAAQQRSGAVWPLSLIDRGRGQFKWVKLATAEVYSERGAYLKQICGEP